jgi:hypothetical protein
MLRRPSPSIPISCGLWSLRDMLDCWGYLYLTTGAALAYAETTLEQQRARTGGGVAGHGTSKLDPNEDAAHLVEHQCGDVLRLMEPYRDELGPIPTNIEILRVKLQQSRKHHALELFTNDVLDDVRRIKNDFLALLSQRKFYYLAPGAARFYGQPELFGETVAKKFPAAGNDIEWAGNCLALGQPTACVLHLNRAMEIAIHRLAKKLHLQPNAKDNMGSLLGNMTDPIKNMPDKTEAQKRKKEKWAECRTNLYHVKMAWRDPSSHGKQSYDDKQARDILERVKGFMQQLATLL